MISISLRFFFLLEKLGKMQIVSQSAALSIVNPLNNRHIIHSYEILKIVQMRTNLNHKGFGCFLQSQMLENYSHDKHRELNFERLIEAKNTTRLMRYFYFLRKVQLKKREEVE